MAAWLAVAGPMAMQAAGGYFNYQAQRDANEINQQNAANNIAMQKEFAQHGIRWKVEDARRAGIAPQAALGASGAAFSPVSVGAEANTAIGDSLNSMGQNISRAQLATATKEERNHNALMKVEQYKNAQLQNKILESQLINMNQPANPPLPSAQDNNLIPGQSDSGSVVVQPSTPTASSRYNTGVQAGGINAIQYSREADGSLSVVPSKDMKERIEDDFIAEMGWHLKNRMLPPAPSTKEFPLPPDAVREGKKYWFWNPFLQKFVPSQNPNR